jgi:hypothetical protein
MAWDKANEANAKARESKLAVDSQHVFLSRAFNGTPERTCAHFGCARVLTAREILFGDKCIDHSIVFLTSGKR